MTRPTQIHIDLNAIQHNCALVRQLAPQSGLVAMVKADAYGHGSVQVAKALSGQVEKFGVCCLEEAVNLRNSGIKTPIVLLEGCFTRDEYQQASQLNFEVVMHSQEQLSMLQSIALEGLLTVWLKVDTGMHRLGLPMGDVAEVYQQLVTHPGIAQIILTSHFANADNAASEFTTLQLQRFAQLQDDPCFASINLPFSLANSAAIMAWPQSHGNWVRPGIMLYGLNPFDFAQQHAEQLIPAMSFTSQIIAIHPINAGDMVGYGNSWTAQRPSIIATVAAGYGDGYPRTAKSGTPVLVNGERVNLVGRVSMDMLCVDVTDLLDVRVGDAVELWGKNLSVNEVAGYAGTIGYELVTRMPQRAKKVYV
jgi:alanine racemase